MDENIGIVIIATNAYFVLGVRFIKKFAYHYKGKSHVRFYFFSDEDPCPYLPDSLDVIFNRETHANWVDGTNSKFKNIISLEECDIDYLYYFDADTNVAKPFDEGWFLGELVGGEHYGNKDWLKDCQGMDKNPLSRAYVPSDTTLPCTYYYGAFFGGRKQKMVGLCKVLMNNQMEDKKIFYEPVWNDESYINQYFHINPPSRTVSNKDFMFLISDKGDIGNTKDTSLDLSELKKKMLEHKDGVYDIAKRDLVHIPIA